MVERVVAAPVVPGLGRWGNRKKRRARARAREREKKEIGMIRLLRLDNSSLSSSFLRITAGFVVRGRTSARGQEILECDEWVGGIKYEYVGYKMVSEYEHERESKHVRERGRARGWEKTMATRTSVFTSLEGKDLVGNGLEVVRAYQSHLIADPSHQPDSNYTPQQRALVPRPSDSLNPSSSRVRSSFPRVRSPATLQDIALLQYTRRAFPGAAKLAFLGASLLTEAGYLVDYWRWWERVVPMVRLNSHIASFVALSLIASRLYRHFFFVLPVRHITPRTPLPGCPPRVSPISS